MIIVMPLIVVIAFSALFYITLHAKGIGRLQKPKRVDYTRINRLEAELGLPQSNYREYGVEPLDVFQRHLDENDQWISETNKILNPPPPLTFEERVSKTTAALTATYAVPPYITGHRPNATHSPGQYRVYSADAMPREGGCICCTYMEVPRIDEKNFATWNATRNAVAVFVTVLPPITTHRRHDTFDFINARSALVAFFARNYRELMLGWSVGEPQMAGGSYMPPQSNPHRLHVTVTLRPPPHRCPPPSDPFIVL